jgi:hypothetical protein
MRLDRNALFVVLLSLSTSSTNAFSTPLNHASPLMRTTTTAISPSSLFMSEKQVYEINRAMDDLAEKCGDIKKPVVTLASQVEDMYNEAERKDAISFNVMLKAWGKATAVLERRKYAPAQNSNVATMTGGVTVAVYTPRDAAEHLTKHLMTAEESYEADPDHAQVIPDETSYNIAIGECVFAVVLFRCKQTTPRITFLLIYGCTAVNNVLDSPPL